MRADGIRRYRQFTRGAVAAGTLDIYREVAERRSHAAAVNPGRRHSRGPIEEKG